MTLKIACSKNGKIFDYKNPKLWITNKIARYYSHYQRLEHDGILIGSNTANIDNPRLNCRIRDMNDYSPIRFVINRNLSLLKNLKIFSAKDKKTFLISDIDNKNKKKIKNYSNANCIFLETKKNMFKMLFKKLAEIGISNLMVEGGSILNTLFLKKKIADKIVIHRGSFYMNENSMNIFNSQKDYDKLFMKDFKLNKTFNLDDNQIEIYESNNLKEYKSKILEKF